jgi:hypothetical protein
MGKKPQRHTWSEAKKLCHLNQFDMEVRAIPSSKQQWKLPVKDWIHERHCTRFGKSAGEKPVDVMPAGNDSGPSSPFAAAGPFRQARGSGGSIAIKLRDYVRKHLKANPGSDEREITARILSALEAYKAGERCGCGEPIWVIGSSEAGRACFTCITGESDPSEDYEIAEACHRRPLPHNSPDTDAPLPTVFLDSDQSDRDVPF